MKIPFSFFLLIIFLSSHSCNSSPAEKIADGFDTAHYRKLTDSLFTKILETPIHTECSVNYISVKTQSKNYTALHPETDSSIKKYLFDTGKGLKRFSNYVVTAAYSSAGNAENAMADLRKQGGSGETPGLTYTNDYVVRFDNKIYWVNSSCSYAYFNHRKIIDNLLKCISHTMPANDSIVCRCGFECD